MATRLEERLRRYGETFERAIVTDAGRDPDRVREHVAWHRRRFVVAFGAAAVVVGAAVMIAMIVRSGDQSDLAPRRQPQPIPSLGVEAVWPGPEIREADHSAPSSTAENFVRDVVGEDPVEVVADANALPNSPTWMTVTLSSGASFRLLTSPASTNEWVVLQVGAPRFSYGAIPPALRLDSSITVIESDGPPTTVARIMSGGQAIWRDAAGVHVKDFSPQDAGNGYIPIDVSELLYSAVVVFRDDSGDVLDVSGAQFGPVPGEPVPSTDALPQTNDPSEEEAPETSERSLIRVAVRNAGQPAGTAINKTNQLRALGYNLLPAATDPARVGVTVQCRPGFEDAAAVLAADVGEGARVEPFEPPSGGHENADCIVYMGA